MKRILLVITALLAVASTCLSAAERHEVKVGEFTQLNVTDNINVDYVCCPDSSGMAVFAADAKVVSGILFENNGKGKLTIQVTPDVLAAGHLPTVTVYSSSLQEAKNQGDSTLRLVRLAKTPVLKCVITDNGCLVAHGIDAVTAQLNISTGRGKIVADGRCTNLRVKNVGKGEIQADQLPAQSVHCTIIGTGSIGCTVQGGELKVTGSGTGKVYYKGKPSSVTVHKLGSIKAIPLQ